MNNAIVEMNIHIGTRIYIGVNGEINVRVASIHIIELVWVLILEVSVDASTCLGSSIHQFIRVTRLYTWQS